MTFAKQEWEIPGSAEFGSGRYSPEILLTGSGSGSAVALKRGSQRGEYRAPVLDALSPLTRWDKIEWEVDANYSARDETCKCPSPGSPLTPVVLSYGVSDAGEPTCTQRLPWPLPEIGSEYVQKNARGRYLDICAWLHKRAAAGMVDPDLAPGAAGDGIMGLEPSLQRLKVTYYARAALAESETVAPTSLKAWGEVTYATRLPAGTALAVDVLAEDGKTLFQNVPSPFPLGGAVDPFVHPALKLRVRMACAAADPEKRPALLAWGIDWNEMGERIRLSRSSFVPRDGEEVVGMVCMKAAGRLRVEVHDGKGDTIRSLMDRRVPARAAVFRWDGRDDAGAMAVGGAYFITATVAGATGTRKVWLR